MSRTLLILLAASWGGAACDLPQNQDPSAAAPDVVGGGTYRFIRITDGDGNEPATAPGADIDAIVVFSAEEFVSAGCAEASLFDENRVVHADNPHLDPDKGTLSFKEQSEGHGFVSLGGGTLICELPIAVTEGDVITIWEVEADKADPYGIVLAEDASDGATVNIGSFSGSAEIAVP